MRILTSFVTSAALLITAGLIGCADPTDPFDTLVTTATTATTMTGDGDGDTGTTGDGDGDTGDGDGDATGDGDGDCVLGMIGEPCDDTCGCADGLTCDGTMTCSLGGGDGDGDSGDGDGDTGGDCNTYDPMMCPMGSLVMVMGLEGNFCGCPCSTNADCPMGPPGTTGACALVLGGGMAPTNCGLICSLMADSCPAGSTCKSAGQSDPDIGLCTFP